VVATVVRPVPMVRLVLEHLVRQIVIKDMVHLFEMDGVSL
jgi:hypothetical protein